MKKWNELDLSQWEGKIGSAPKQMKKKFNYETPLMQILPDGQN